MNKKYLIFALLFLLTVLPAFITQFQVEPDDDTPQIEISGIDPSNAPIYRITVNVTDGIGQSITDLSADEFVLGGALAEIAELVSIENITNDNLPLSVVLAIDTSSSMSGRPLEQAQAAARLFVESLAPDDSVAIVAFNTRPRLVQDYTTDRQALINAINNIPFGGQTALYDGSLDAILRASESPVERHAVIILSDGAESDGLGGVLSTSLREDAARIARNEGVPVYTIGLGFGVDRTYLEQLASATNGRNYESPTPDELTTIYGEIASILRSQYVLTYTVDVPLDGTEYDFTLQAITPAGETNVIDGVLRAPVPVPVIRFPNIPETPIDTLTDITVQVNADDALTQVLVDDEAVTVNEDNTFTITIDPVMLPPGAGSTTITVTDDSGDTVTETLNYEIVALPSVVTVEQDISELVITEPTDLTLNVSGQTPPLVISATVGDEVIISETTPFTLTIDPANFAPGEQIIPVEVVNEGGVTATTDLTVNIGALPPVVTITGIDSGAMLEGSFMPGETVTVNVDVTSQTEVTGVVYSVDGTEITTQTEAPYTFDLELLPLGTGSHTLEVTVNNVGEQSTTESITFTVNVIPTPTPTFTPTNTPTNTPTITNTPTPTVDVEGTANAEATSTAVAVAMTGTADAVATGNARATQNANATITQEAVNAQATTDAQATNDTQATQNANATATQEAVNAQATTDAQATVDTQATNDAQATLDVQATSDAQLTATQQIIDDNATATQDVLDQQATQNARATQNLQATTDAQATQDVQSTQDTAIVRNAQATQDAINRLNELATLDAQLTLDAQATTDAEATQEAEATTDNMTAIAQASVNQQATEDTQATQDAEASLTAQATDTPEPSNTPEPTATPEPTETATDAPTATVEVTEEVTPEITVEVTAEVTEEVTPEITAEPTEAIEASATADPATATPVEITEVEAQDAPEDTSDPLPLIVIAIVGLLFIILVVVFFVARRRRDEA